MQTLLVASAGGHFEELRLLKDRLGLAPGETTWVTWDTPQTRSAVGDDEWIHIKRSHPRDIRRTMGDTIVARRILSSRRWDRVISTGSLVAVPFLTVARAYGIASHYIESAARTTGPSLSARILERVPGVHCYAQSRSWASSRKSWKYRGSVFDAFTAELRPPAEIHRVVVALGTSRYGFPRLVTALSDVLPGSVDVVWQVGATEVGPLYGDTHAHMPQHELTEAMRAADLVIAHAGVGTALQAMSAGHCPLLVPRRAAHGEHVDDHQFQVAAQLTHSGLATSCEPEEISLDLLTSAAARRVRPTCDLPEFVLDER